MTRDRIVCFMGESRYDAIGERMRLLLSAFAEEGFAVDALPQRAWTDALDADQSRIAFYFCPQGWRPRAALPRPILALFGDHPIYHLPRILPLAGQEAVACFPHPAATAFLASIAPHIATALSPPAGDPVADATERERDLECVFVGAPVPSEKKKHRPKTPKFITRLGARTAERLVAGDATAFETLFRQGMTQFKLKAPGIAEDVCLQVLSHAASVADFRARSTYRTAMLKALRDLPVTVYGEGWSALLDVEGKAMRLKGSIPYGEVRALYGRSRTVLNLMPPYYALHERIFDALAYGAVPVTAPAPGLAACFDTDMVAHLPQPKRAAPALEALLADPAALAERAAAGRQRLAERFTNRCRARDLLDMARQRGWLEP